MQELIQSFEGAAASPFDTPTDTTNNSDDETETRAPVIVKIETIKTQSPTPPPAPPVPSPAQRITNMPDNIQTFRGNGSSLDPKPQSFFKACRAHIIGMVGVGEPEKMEWFELKLEAASEAEKWYDKLDSQYKKSMSTLKPEFDKRFPPEVVKELTAADKWDTLSKFKLSEEEMMTLDADGVTGYSKWASKMLRMSDGVDDTNKVFVPMVIKNQIPTVLRKLVDKPDTFAELAKQIQGVDRTLLDEKLEKKKVQRAQETYIAQKKAADAAQASGPRQRPAPETPTRGAAGLMANMSFGSPMAQSQPIQSLFAQLQRQQSQQQQHAPPAPAVAPQPRRPAAGGSWAEPTAEDAALRLREPAVRMADLIRTKLARATNQNDYNAQVAAFDTAHGNAVPTEARPYPLTPGTADIATRECIGCGYVHDGACVQPRIPVKERTYRIAANVIHKIPRAAQQVQGQGQARQAAGTPVMDIMLLSILQAYEAQRNQIMGGGVEYPSAFIEDVEQGNGDGTSG